MRRRPKHLEDEIHTSIYSFLLRVLPRSWIAFHPANGGWRDPRTAGKFKRLGVLPGVADIILLGPVGRVACIEVKIEGGRLSPAQVWFSSHCKACGIPYTVARSIEDVRAFLDNCNIETREASR